MPDDQSPKKPGIDRRSFLIGATSGAAATALGAAGVAKVQSMGRKLRTPEAVEAGKAAQVAESFEDSHPAYTGDVKAPAGAPNIVVIVLDDVGFADLGAYGSEIRTPNVDQLAAQGLRYANFRTCAMCSPTRAALMTGLNHHSAGMGWLADLDSGYPGYRGDLTLEAATLAEVLRDAGWSTVHVGKWHVNNSASNGPDGPYHNWPTNRGFDRAYWFQGHSTDYFKPSELIDGVAPVEPPESDDFFANDHLTDRAIAYVRTQKMVAPDKPFYMQICYPAAHSPLQTRRRDRDAYKGAYDAGWDVVRAKRLERQRAMGLVPETTELPPLSPGAQPWDSLTPAQKELYARYMEVYAGLISNVDANIGRFVATLEDLGQRDNTLILVFSDNGGSAEGTPTGTPNVFAPALGRPVPVEEAAKLADTMGEDPTFPHYPIGWTRHERGKPFDEDVWELYDTATDPNELNNLAAQHPEKVEELKAKWTAAAEKYGVFPLDDRNFVVKMAEDRQRRGMRSKWEFKPPIERISSQVAPYVCGFTHSIEIDIVRPTGRGDGVLLAHGSKPGGYVLHIKDGRLIYEQSMVPWNERIESADALPDGPVTVKYVQTMTSRPFDGTGALFVNGGQVAEHKFARCIVSTSYDGFSLGADLGNQVSTLYRNTNPFQGEIVVVRITIDSTPFTPLESMRFLDAIGTRV